MAHTEEFNGDFWVGVFTVAPVLLVAFAATVVDLLIQNRYTEKNRFELHGWPIGRWWVAFWVNAVPPLGGLLTLFAMIVLSLHHDEQWERVLAMIAMFFLVFGLVSSSVTLNWFRQFEAEANQP